MNVLVYQPDIAGNLGNIVRTACALFVDNVYVYDPDRNTMDMKSHHNSNRTIAISQGGWQTLDPTIFYNDAKVKQFLREYQGRKVAAICDRKDATNLYSLVCASSDLVLIGNEKKGLPEDVVEMCDIRLTIPMRKGMHSLNSASAFAVIASRYAEQSYRNL